jgi:hypothetical protein
MKEAAERCFSSYNKPILYYIKSRDSLKGENAEALWGLRVQAPSAPGFKRFRGFKGWWWGAF